LIAEDGAPKAKRTFVFWNPPLLDDLTRASANMTTSNLLVSFAQSGFSTLAFSRARVSAELVLRYAREAAARTDILDPAAIESYRAGYTPKERRQIEKALFNGKLLGLSATNAMELGVDVGGLDIVLMNGYPGTISSFWQQAGRAGRGTRDGLAVMVAHDDPLEQFLVREPNLILGADNERVALNPLNPPILEQQIRCAAFERPIAPSELEGFGGTALDMAEIMDRAGDLEFRAGRFYYPSHEPPAPKVSIRGGGGEQIRLYLNGEEIGSMEFWRALQSAHEGAVYLHRGVTYVVEKLDLDKGQAHLAQRNVDYYTQAMVQSVIVSQEPFREQRLRQATVGLCGITVTDLVTGYKVKSLDGDSVLGVHELSLPPTTYDTVAIQFNLPAAEVEESELVVAGVHGMEHALMALAPLLAGTDRGDLGSAWYAMYPTTFAPAIFIFDRTPGGVGLSEKLFDSLTGWLSGAYQLLTSCTCEEGCPACLLSARCEANNEMLSKREALQLLQG
jgi:DEAD/DEAH box helicase domain-containing protein